jgi:hypothetical protein
VFAVLVPPLGLVFGVEDFIASGTDAPSGGRASIGCPAAQFFPGTILLPFGLKATARYSRVAVDGSGIVAAGTFSTSPRSPSASINGSTALTVESGHSAVGLYTAIASDLRPPLSYSWSAAGGVSQPTDFGTSVTFASGATTGGVSVTVTDVDDLSATANVTVTFREVVPTDPGDAPRCHKQPNKPQCHEP